MRHECNHRYRAQTRFYTVPQVSVGISYGYAGSGAVIVYQPLALHGRRY
jgi:hypothetical protein